MTWNLRRQYKDFGGGTKRVLLNLKQDIGPDQDQVRKAGLQCKHWIIHILTRPFRDPNLFYMFPCRVLHTQPPALSSQELNRVTPLQ